jgi:hypothetical protein
MFHKPSGVLLSWVEISVKKTTDGISFSIYLTGCRICSVERGGWLVKASLTNSKPPARYN